MNLTIEEMRMLAQIERDMDSGTQPFVTVESSSDRWAMNPDILAECGIVSGQRISRTMLETLLQMSLANITTEIALQKAQSK